MIIPGTNYSTWYKAMLVPGTTGTSSSRYSVAALFCDGIGAGLPSQGSGHVES